MISLVFFIARITSLAPLLLSSFLVFVFILRNLLFLMKDFRIVFLLLLTEIKLNLVQVEIDQLYLLDDDLHQSTAFFRNVLPELDHV